MPIDDRRRADPAGGAGPALRARGARRSRARPIGLVHRDVSPRNIFVTYHGVVKLLDFGVVRGPERQKSIPGVFKGKYGYCAPEQIEGRPVDRRTDVFCLGIALWECLTGARLFDASTDAATIDAVRSRPIEAPSALRPDDSAGAGRDHAARARARSGPSLPDRARHVRGAGSLPARAGRPPDQQERGPLDGVDLRGRAGVVEEGDQPGRRGRSDARSVVRAERDPAGERRAAPASGPARPAGRRRRSRARCGRPASAATRRATGAPGLGRVRPKRPSAPLVVRRPRRRPPRRPRRPGRQRRRCGRRRDGGRAPPAAARKSPRAADRAGRRAGAGAASAPSRRSRCAASGRSRTRRRRVRRARRRRWRSSSQPPGAHVFVDGSPSGLRTPAVLNGLPVGQHACRSGSTRPGYEPVTEQVDAEAGGQTLSFTLRGAQRHVRLVGVPAARRVYLDDRQVDAGKPLAAAPGRTGCASRPPTASCFRRPSRSRRAPRSPSTSTATEPQ